MSSVVIENFRFGLDTRRSSLTSALGTLEVCNNAHINQGGEIEKRKAFVATDLTPTPASGVVILGIEPLKDTIVIFGGVANADSANWPPNGYTYLRLYRNPAASAAGGVCDTVGTPNYCTQCAAFAASVNATSVIHSTSFNNKTWVLAGMTDGTIAAFYDGVVVEDINYNGRVLPGNNTKLAMFCDLVRSFEGVENYTADLKMNGATLEGIRITGPVGKTFTTELEVTGSLDSATPPVAAFSSASTQTIPGRKASGFFQIQDGHSRGSTNRITSVRYGNTGIGWTELLNAQVNYTTDPETTAALVAASINAETTFSGFTATNNGSTVTIYATAEGTTNNGKQLQVITTGIVIIGKCSLTFSGSGFTLGYIKANGVNLLTTTFVYPTSAETLTTFVGRVVTNINSGTATHGYIALGRGDVLKLSKVTTQSDSDPITGVEDVPRERGMTTINVQVTPASEKTGFVTDADYSILQAVIDTSLISVYFPITFIGRPDQAQYNFPQGLKGTTTKAVRAIVVGGVGPYKYNWRIEDPENMSVSIESPNSDATHITDYASPRAIADLAAKKAYLYLDVTDSSGQRATSSGVPIQAARG